MKKQLAMYVGFAFTATAMYLIAVALMFDPTPVVGLISIVVSLLGAAIVRWLLEYRSVHGMFSPKSQSWAFVLGDGIALPISLLMIGFARSEVVIIGFWVQWPWFVISAGIGLMGGVLFHLMDRRRYLDASAGLTLASPTKVWHDFVTYPVLLAVLVWSGIPLLDHEYWTWPTVIVMIAILTWIGLGVCDVIRKLDPLDQHPEWDKVEFSVI